MSESTVNKRITSYNEYDIIIKGIIDFEENPLTEELFILKNANFGDKVNIEIVSGGGNVYDGNLIISNIVQCKAKVEISIIYAASMAAYIALTPINVSYHVPKTSVVFLHNMAIDGYLPLDKHRIRNDALDKLNTCMTSTLDGFLTKKEIKELESGKDFYFIGDEIVERIKRKVKEDKKFIDSLTN